MKRNVLKSVSLLLALICLFSLGLAGCGNKEVSDKKVITIWTNGRSEAEIRQKQVEEFNKTNQSGIEVQLVLKSDDFVDALKASYQSNSSPDIHPSNPKLDTGAVKNGWYREFDEETVNYFTERLLLPAIGSLRDNDNRMVKYTVKTGGISSHRLIYNKDLFKECGLDPEQSPKTWDELVEYARIITEKGNGKKYGFGLPLKSNAFIHYYVLNPAIPSGVNVVNGYDPVEGRFDFTQYADMIEVLKKLIDDGSCFPSPATIDNDMARAQFAEGNIGMMAAYSWDVGVFSEQFPTKCDWACVDFPTMTGEVIGGYPAAIGGGASYVMSAQSKYPEEQLEVFKWFNGEEVATELQEAGVGNFQFKSLVGTDKINKTLKGAAELYSASSPAFFIEGVGGYNNPSSYMKIEGDTYADTIGNIIKADLNTKETLEQLTKRYNDALDKHIEEDKPDTSKYINKEWNPVVDIESIIK